MPDGTSAHDSWYEAQGGFRYDWTGVVDSVMAQGDVYRALEREATPGDRLVAGGDVLARWRHHSERSDLQLQAYYDMSERAEPFGGGAFVLHTYDVELQQSLDLGARNTFVWGAGERHRGHALESAQLASAQLAIGERASEKKEDWRGAWVDCRSPTACGLREFPAAGAQVRGASLRDVIYHGLALIISDLARRNMVERYIETRLRHVYLRRGGREILRDIGWTIRPGERWILAGANGAGKTQLLKLVAGSVWPTPCERTERSYVRHGELHVTPAEVHAEIGYVGPERQDRYERYGWNHTVEQVVGTGLHRTDIPLEPLTPADRRRIAALLARIGLSALAGRRFLTLSYGERRLVLLARALAARPKLLLLDELLNGLDAERRAATLRWLARTRRSALPWVLATHRMEDVPPGATHALVLDRGRAVYRGPIARAPLAKWLPGESPVRSCSPRALRTAQRANGTGPGERLVRLTRASVYLDARRVLEGITLEIARGECWLVHGPNGSGKSTLLRTIYGDHAVAVGGRIERAGIEPGVPLETFKRAVGLVAPHLQSSLAATTSLLAVRPGATRDLTVSETVQSGRFASYGLDEPASLADRRAAQRALAAFGLGALATRTLRELSYGQLRRVLFARAWINRPVLLLLDEPFTGIDAPTRGALLRELEAIAASGATLVMATHHRQEWPACATHELELRGGRAVYCGAVRSAPVRQPAIANGDRR